MNSVKAKEVNDTNHKHKLTIVSCNLRIEDKKLHILLCIKLTDRGGKPQIGKIYPSYTQSCGKKILSGKHRCGGIENKLRIG